MRGREIAWGAGVVVAAIAGWWLGRAHQAGPVADTVGLPPAAVAVASVPSSPEPASNPPPSASSRNEPLPRLSVPLRLSLPDLQRRADAGDAAAACRLATEWTYCRQLRLRLEIAGHSLDTPGFQRSLERMDTQTRERAVAYREQNLARMQADAETLLADSAHCEGVVEPEPREVLRRWRQAALGGNVEAMRQYATGAVIPQGRTLQLLPELEQYRHEAEGIALRAVEAGDLETAAALAHAYASENDMGFGTYLPQAVEYDPARALTLYLRVRAAAPPGPASEFAERHMGGSIEALGNKLSPERRGQAQTQARAARPLINFSGAVPTATLNIGRVEEADRADCDGSGPRTMTIMSGAP